jgi:hypothetical protein
MAEHEILHMSKTTRAMAMIIQLWISHTFLARSLRKVTTSRVEEEIEGWTPRDPGSSPFGQSSEELI